MREAIEKIFKKGQNKKIDDQIDLSYQNISDSEIKEIAEKIVQTTPQIQEVFLNNNSISDVGIENLVAVFSKLTTLRTIDLQFNESL